MAERKTTTKKTAKPAPVAHELADEVDDTADDAVETPKRPRIPVLDELADETEESAAKSTKPKHFVAGNHFFAQMDDGWELKVPIRLSVKNVKTLQNLGDDADELDQLVELFKLLGDEDVVARLEDADFLEATDTALKYFQAWEEKNEARLGELGRSSI